MIRVIHVVRTMNIGGLENVVRNILLTSNREEISCDCLICEQESTAYEDELKANGIEIYKIHAPEKSKVKFYKELKGFFETHKQYDIVHAHMAFSNGVIAFAARSAGIKCVISHSHGVQLPSEGSFIRKPYESLMRIWMRKYSTRWMACSKEAGEYLFGSSCFNKKGDIILNGIDIEKYQFDEKIRSDVREKMGIQNNKVLGTVGSIVPAKNQIQIIKILKAIKDSKYKLIIVGDGPEKSKLTEYAAENGLLKQIFITGKQRDIVPYLNAMDVFVFPSISEGFGIAFIEAQANGLPCVISDKIQSEAKIASNIYTVSLDDPLDRWVNKVETAIQNGRENNLDSLQKCGMDTKTNCEKIFSIYRDIFIYS